MYGFRHRFKRVAPTELTSESINEQKALYEKWERSNHMSLKIMKDSITPIICRVILGSDIIYLVA